MTGDVLLEVEDLTVVFPGDREEVPAVRGISYRLRAREVLGIVGESGSGKSVSALAVMGLLPPRARVGGSARYRGDELLTMDDKAASAIRGSRISIIFQDSQSALTPVYTIGEHIAEAVRAHHDIPQRRAVERAVELLELVGIPEPRKRAAALPHECSGGMRQRVMIAMAIANQPDVIIADEPTTALDVTVQAQILDVLRTARDVTGAGIILITHDLGVIAGMADRVHVMYAGKVVESASVDDLFHRPHMPYTLGLLGSVPRLDVGTGPTLTRIEGTPPSPAASHRGCAFAPRCPLAVPACATEEPPPRRLPGTGEPHVAACHRSDDVYRDGLTSADIFASATPGRAEVAPARRSERAAVLRVDGLVRHFPVKAGGFFAGRRDAVHAVNGISFEVREGETLALVGESGSGKTTTLLQVLGLTRPQAGRIEVLGRDTAALTTAQRFALRREVQIVFQDPMASLDPRMPVADIVAEPLRTHGVPRAEYRRRVPELLVAVGLGPEHLDRYPHEFSGGQCQRIAIARALALRPKLLVLDEPVSALDMSVRAGVIGVLDSLRDRFGMSYLLVSHDLAMVRHLADRVAVMYRGRIVEVGTVTEVFDAPSHPYTQALLSAVPLPDPRKERGRPRIVLHGEPADPGRQSTGCQFRTRCPRVPALGEGPRRLCRTEDPPERPTGPTDRRTACHHPASQRLPDLT